MISRLNACNYYGGGYPDGAFDIEYENDPNEMNEDLVSPAAMAEEHAE